MNAFIMSREALKKKKDEVKMDDSIFWEEYLEEDFPDNPIVLADLEEGKQEKLKKLFE